MLSKWRVLMAIDPLRPMKLEHIQNTRNLTFWPLSSFFRVQHSSVRVGTVKIGKQHEAIWSSTKAAVA